MPQRGQRRGRASGGRRPRIDGETCPPKPGISALHPPSSSCIPATVPSGRPAVPRPRPAKPPPRRGQSPWVVGAQCIQCQCSSVVILHCGCGVTESLAQCHAVPALCRGARCPELTCGDVLVTPAATKPPHAPTSPSPETGLKRDIPPTRGC